MEATVQNYSVPDVATVILGTQEMRKLASATGTSRPYLSPVSVLILTIAAGLCVVYNRRRSHMVRLIGKVPGPAAMPIVGNMVECNVQHDGES